MNYEMTGTVKVILEPKTFDSGFSVREFVLTVEDGKYPQEIILQVVQEKVSLLDEIAVGQQATVMFDVRGREHNGRWFNNLQAWKIEAVGGATSAPEPELDDGGDIPF